MKRRMFFLIVSSLMCLIFVGCTSNGRGVMSEELITSTITIREKDNKTLMEVEMIANESVSKGSESWQKDEEISFMVKSSKRAEVEIGIVPVLENGDYGEALSQSCEIDIQGKKISIKVPADGEYGICFINKANSDVSFQAEINKILENSFV